MNLSPQASPAPLGWQFPLAAYTLGLSEERELSAAEVERIYRQYAPLIHGRCLAILGHPDDAQDALQDIFVTLLGKLDSFRGEAALFTWVYRVSTNHCLNRLRGDRRRRRAARRMDLATIRRHDEGDAAAVERRMLLTRMLQKMSERQVQILVHTHYDEMTQAEIGQVLGISDRAVRKALRKIKLDASAAAALEGSP